MAEEEAQPRYQWWGGQEAGRTIGQAGGGFKLCREQLTILEDSRTGQVIGSFSHLLTIEQSSLLMIFSISMKMYAAKQM